MPIKFFGLSMPTGALVTLLEPFLALWMPIKISTDAFIRGKRPIDLFVADSKTVDVLDLLQYLMRTSFFAAGAQK